ncbi:alpha/beta hydrolase family protein [Sphingomonas sp. Leaf343]|uniref:alpha/beta hydrolase family protein n=1 Tax=Sphingomonas sp. Leaf343 TaxID=1736345 RepID=UPI00070070AA|nr:S9 family peptidase [Sphingomonas sp. Leaf343]KQR83518.1 hypothetical protein ASG07_07295 [Sphingomonas sp. Leaf343]
MKYAYVVVLAALSVGASATAQVNLDAKAAAAAFGAREHVIDASLSPDGSKVAMVVPGPVQSTVVQLLDMQTGSAKAINYAKGDPMTLTTCGWASNARLVCSLYGISNVAMGGYLAYQRLIAFGADGADPISLGTKERVKLYASQSDGYVVDWRDGASDNVLIARNYIPARAEANFSGGIANGLGVDLIDTRTGKVDHVEGAHPRATGYLGDGKGTIRLMMLDNQRLSAETRGITEIFYRQPGKRDWLPLGTYNSVTETGIYPVAIDSTANVAYVLKGLNGRDALYRITLDGSGKEELAYSNADVDVSGVVRIGRSGRVVAASYASDDHSSTIFDPEFKKLVAGFGRALPALPLIRVVDSSADEQVHLVYAASDTDPGRYFLFDSNNKSLSPLGQDRPELAGVTLGTVKPISYRAADGTMIPAYLTLPPGGTGKNLPAIVMPHGGPAARDEWGFDWLAQFFVNRGYAVIQPNYRGSAGYGQQWFQQNGFKSWKTAIGDVTDAGRWLVAEGIADPAKLAIVGWSYGGYPALQSQVVAPDLFKAVVAIAPVTDLGMLRAEKVGFTNTTLARNYIGDGPHLEEGSPARHAAAFKAPVLMFHGDKDINVDVGESRAMDRQLKAAKKSSGLVVYPGIDHQLRDSAVRTDMLARADAFLTATMIR